MAAPIEIIDDDDEFDWEAAVQEIEVACRNAGTSTASSSHPPSPPEPQPCLSALKGTSLGRNLRTSYAHLDKPQRNHRQLKLDNFISNANSKNHCRKHIDEDRDAGDGVEVDEMDCFVKIDPVTSKTWIYPENIPPRDYQMAITRTALFSNTLVVLPTGLGKTLIAAVVMYNYFRWFPEGKIVFAAPSRPLVLQQIQACHQMVGIPQESTIDMTGLTNPSKRACLWKEKRVFFVTPQVFERDIQSGACLIKYLVCLVIDEAHRATGNFSFCVAVRELLAVPVKLRILALTATPGSKQQKIQDVIDNLHISTLEYRDESDEDVSPYVHNRQLELMKVPMGQTAVEVTNLLSDVMRPIAARLSTMGVLQNRDVLTLSPCDLLNSREKFRQAPPPALSHMKYGEVEGYFGVLITLYHIRKLLSSHGVKPAYEMLEEKLRQGSFAKFMSRNEVIQRAKLLMQQSLSHGAPSPKLSKMIEVLTDHFQKNDPQNSRVIIFSNFRGSVRDIMDSLADLGGTVKATQFIGQSSGKLLKGQTQKVQQAVLQKFRNGGYNVIVATSIGEEGLDIMEVDLVICFDANISPLRMIQRMGRTGRKHDGRVVVLACEGAELKGYLRKQSSGKAIRKHMRNGGMNSFTFHSSSRMVPHVFKPEIQLVKLAIKQFVPRGRNVKDDSIEEPTSIEKLTDAEADTLAKYFGPKKTTWKPSLIAFPHFQAFPSRVHSVMHSSRTGMLIDLMQHIQGLSFSEDRRSLSIEASGQHHTSGNVEQHTEGRQDEQKELSNTTVSASDVLILEKSSIQELSVDNTDTIDPAGTFVSMDKSCKLYSSGKSMLQLPGNSECEEHRKPYPACNTSHLHSFLFGSEVASVDISGRVLVAPVPVVVPFKEISDCESKDGRNMSLPNCSDTISCHAKTAFGGCEGLRVQTDAMCPSNHYRMDMEAVLRSQLSPDAQMAPTSGARSDERIRQSPPLEEHDANQMSCFHEAADVMVHTLTSSPQLDGDAGELDLSPRLTNFIESGFVPESPLNDTDARNADVRNEILVPKHTSPTKFSSPCTRHVDTSSSKVQAFLADAPNADTRNEILVPKHTSPTKFSSPCTRHVEASPCKVQVYTPALKMAKDTLTTRGILDSPSSGKYLSPLQDLTNCSKDWYMSSGKKSGYAEQNRRLKRLRKIGETGKEKASMRPKENSAIVSELVGRGNRTILINHSKGDEDCYINAKDLIDEEAQVCTSAEVSADEEDDPDSDSYEDSFIDDRVNPTAVSTHAEDGRIDMMAIYRRSLLSQSPITRQKKNGVIRSPESVVSLTKITESGGSSENTTNLLNKLGCDGRYAYISGERNSVSSHIDLQAMSTEAVASTSGRIHVSDSIAGSRKRKLSSMGACSINAINLEKDVFSLSDATASKASPLHHQDQSTTSDINDTFFCDDQFYASLDLDALEAQATKLVTQKAKSLKQMEKRQEPTPSNISMMGPPSFDLGIS